MPGEGKSRAFLPGSHQGLVPDVLQPKLGPASEILRPTVQEILRDTQIVRDGLGDLLLASAMQTDGVGILYSQPSGYAAKVQASPTFGSYESSHTAFHGALRELGLNFLYFTDRQMRLGEASAIW